MSDLSTLPSDRDTVTGDQPDSHTIYYKALGNDEKELEITRKEIEWDQDQVAEHAKTPSGSVNELNSKVVISHEELPQNSDKDVLDDRANVLLTRDEQGGQEHDLDDAITLYRQALECCPPHDPDRSTSLCNLAGALWTRFHEGGQENDLDDVILLHRQNIEVCLPPHPDQHMSLNNLAIGLHIRYERRGQTDDLDESIALQRRILEFLPLDHLDRLSSLSNLANALRTQYEQGGQQCALDESISLHRHALELCPPPHPDRSIHLNNLALSLGTRYEKRGDQHDLDESTSLHRQAVEHCPAHDFHQSHFLNNLAVALQNQYEQRGQQHDLDKSISLFRQVIDLRPLLHSDRFRSLDNLATALHTRYEQGGQKCDLDESISLHRQALDLLPLSHLEYCITLNNLANALTTRYEQEGQQCDLDEGISLHRQALELCSSHDHNRYSFLDNLAIALWTKYTQKGQQCDLDESIFLHRQALELCSSPHPGQSMSLNNLAVSLWTRYQKEGQQHDLDESISLHRQALELRSPPHLNRSSSLNNLALALGARHKQKGDQCDLDESISLHRQTLDLSSSSHPNQSAALNNLAIALGTQYMQQYQNDDLEESICLHRQALELRPLHHPNRPNSLNNLANSLCIRYEKEGQQQDLDESISLHKQVLKFSALPHSHESTSLYEMGKLFILSHEKNNNSEYLEQAMSSFFAATQCISQTASHRFKVAKTWIYYADVVYQHISAIDAYNAALQALPQLAALSSDIKSRHKALTAGSDGVARDASKCAIQTGNLCKAIEFLDAGRTIFWAQLLSLRSPFDELHSIAPELADHLRHIATALELGSHRKMSVELLDNQLRLIEDQETSQLNSLHEQWANAIKSVRSLKGFEDFLQPHQFLALQAAASKFPVVALVENETDSNIIIMTSTDVYHIPLLTLPADELLRLVQLIQVATSQSKMQRCSVDIFSNDKSAFSLAIQKTLQNWINMEQERGGRKFQNKVNSDDIFKSVLKTLWIDVVKPVITILGLKKSEEPPVLQWCPTGLFSFLPIHAAGCYDNELAVECASDYIISSYTPTIGALLTPDPTPSTKPFKMMVVVQSKDLPSTQEELMKIEQHVPNDSLVQLGIPGSPASVERVAACLSDVSIAHFACHGKQNLSEPLESGLKLEDGFLFVSRIMKEHMPNGSLAFLCACDTAMGDENLPDEAMSLAASLLFSGFRHVIATMWKMMDGDGPIIADAFYEEIFKGPDGKPALQPDTGKSARALHIAINKLRSNNVPFHRWVPFIHMGKGN